MAVLSKLRAVPSPADVPTHTARELVAEIRSRGGRVLRMKQPPSTFVLTNDPELAEWLERKGATHHVARGLNNGGYKRCAGGLDEWDLWIHSIPLVGEETVWETASRG